MRVAIFRLIPLNILFHPYNVLHLRRIGVEYVSVSLCMEMCMFVEVYGGGKVSSLMMVNFLSTCIGCDMGNVMWV